MPINLFKKIGSLFRRKSYMGVTDELNSQNLRRYCKTVSVYIKTYGWSENVINPIRKNILKNIPKDIRDDLKKGYTPEYLIKFFWGEPAFVKLWNDIGLNYDHFQNILDKEVAEATKNKKRQGG